MFFDDSKDPVHLEEVLKWGLFAGFLEGLFIALLTIVYAKQDDIFALAGGWELTAGFLLVLLISASVIITSVIVFAHPIYCLLRRHYRDAALTILVSLLTVAGMAGFAIWTLPYLQ